MGLLWKGSEHPDNYSQAANRLQSLVRTLERLGNKRGHKDILRREYGSLNAIQVEPQPDEPGYYLPHSVIREEATTTKIRVVFGASVHQQDGRTLNEVLNPGPSLLPDLTGLLIRFWQYEFATQADIKQAFKD